MKTTLNTEALKNSGNLHAFFNVAELQIIDNYWIDTTIYELIGNFDKLTVKSYTIDDDFNVNFEAENEPIKAEIFSHGSIFISPEMVKSIISSNGETVEIFQDRHQIVFYIDGKSRYFFDADFLDDIDAKRIEKEEEEKADREEYERKEEEKWGSVPKLESSASIIANFGTIYKGISHMITRGSRAVIEKGVLYIEGSNGVSIRDLNEPRITTDNIINFVKSWKDYKINGILTQFEDGTGSFNSVNRGDLYRPIRYFNQCSNRIDPCYTTGLNVFYPSNLPQILSRFKADDQVIIADKTESIKLVFRVGTLKKSFSHFKTARLTMCSMGRKPYLVIIDDYNLSDLDIIFPLSVDPVDLPVFRIDFKVNNMNKETTPTESAKKAPTLDASTPAAKDTTPANEAPKTQENATQENETKQAEKTPSTCAAVVLSSNDLRGDNFGKTLESVKNALTQGAEQEQKKEATFDGFLNNSKDVWINIAMSNGRFPMKVIYFPSEKIAVVKHKKTWYAIEAMTGGAFYTMPNFHDLLNTLRHPENRTPILALIESMRSKNPVLNPIDEEGNILDISPAEYEKMQAEKQEEKPLQAEKEKQGEKQEEKAPEKQAEETTEKPEPLPEPTPAAAEPAPLPEPLPPAEPAPVKKPLRAIIEEGEEETAEKPFEIGTYTTKKGKIKTAIRFITPPTPAQIEALKKAYFWEYNGTWNGSPRKLPEIFKH